MNGFQFAIIIIVTIMIMYLICTIQRNRQYNNTSMENYIYEPQNHRYLSEMDKKLSPERVYLNIPYDHYACQKPDEVLTTDGRCVSINPDCGCGCYKRFPEYDRFGNVVRYISEHSVK